MKSQSILKTNKFDISLYKSCGEMSGIKTKRLGGRYHCSINHLDNYSAIKAWASNQGYKGFNVKQHSQNKRKSTHYYIVRFYNEPVSQLGIPRLEECNIAYVRVTKKTKF